MPETITSQSLSDLKDLKVDYFYNPEDWETTHNVDDQWAVEEWLQDAPSLESVIVISTLVQGPTVFAASIPISKDEDGEADVWETRYFSSLSAAEEAIRASKSESPNV